MKARLDINFDLERQCFRIYARRGDSCVLMDWLGDAPTSEQEETLLKAGVDTMIVQEDYQDRRAIERLQNRGYTIEYPNN